MPLCAKQTDGDGGLGRIDRLTVASVRAANNGDRIGRCVRWVLAHIDSL